MLQSGRTTQNEVELEGFDEFGTSETFTPIPDINFVASAMETDASQQGGINGKENKRKCKLDAIVEACNEMLTKNIDKLLLAQKLADPKDVLKCLEDIDFDQRYKSNA
ncbi:hypothetical protein LIER_25340 [Lithospermum erythrorhizon]|uniref:Uncharacterized protein n=1 Tax=Lithospermum erythrorhizon TaxID=34254 RepID=A0AAV3R4J0_LITER